MRKQQLNLKIEIIDFCCLTLENIKGNLGGGGRGGGGEGKGKYIKHITSRDREKGEKKIEPSFQLFAVGSCAYLSSPSLC